MRTIRTCLASLLLVAAAAAPAAAQDPTAPADAPFPVLATLDRPTDHTAAFASLGLSFIDEIDLAARIDVGGQYVTPQGFGGYVTLPMSHARGNDDSETELGNLELGGLYVLPAGTGLDVLLRGGLTLPTAPDDLDALINVITLFPRTTDLTSVAGTVTYLRLGASPLLRRDKLFFRADVGLDVPIAEDDGVDADTLYHLNVAGGLETGPVAVAGELVMVGSLDDSDDEVLTTLALSVSGSVEGLRPFGAVVLPVDNELADDLDLSLAVIAGLEIPIAAR